MNDLLPLSLAQLADQAADLAADRWTASSRERYGTAWRGFVGWCRHRALNPMPADPQTVALWAADRCTEVSVRGLQTELAAIGQAHLVMQEDVPTSAPMVRALMRGIRRRHGEPPRRKRAISLADLQAMVAQLPPSIAGARDRAVLTLGWCSAMRRAELAQLCGSHIEEMDEGLLISIPRSKTDQEGNGVLLPVPYATKHVDVCPVIALRRWMQFSGISIGPVFRSVNQHHQLGPSITPKSIGRIVKRAGAAIGLDPADLGGHSLRAGLATECGRAGVPERLIAKQTRHRSIRVLRGYIHDGTLWSEHPLADIL